MLVKHEQYLHMVSGMSDWFIGALTLHLLYPLSQWYPLKEDPPVNKIIILRHLVTILVTACTNPDNMTNNHLIIKLLLFITSCWLISSTSDLYYHWYNIITTTSILVQFQKACFLLNFTSVFLLFLPFQLFCSQNV